MCCIVEKNDTLVALQCVRSRWIGPVCARACNGNETQSQLDRDDAEFERLSVQVDNLVVDKRLVNLNERSIRPRGKFVLASPHILVSVYCDHLFSYLFTRFVFDKRRAQFY